MTTPQEIDRARQAIRGMIYFTPLVTSDSISARVGLKVYLRLENLQKTGSFKMRGACYKIAKLGSSVGIRGVVPASAANHAQGVALAASSHGIPATIVMPDHAPLSKQLATGGYGGKVILRGGKSFEEAESSPRSSLRVGLISSISTAIGSPREFPLEPQTSSWSWKPQGSIISRRSSGN